jgi:hypothetical protein
LTSSFDESGGGDERAQERELKRPLELLDNNAQPSEQACLAADVFCSRTQVSLYLSI